MYSRESLKITSRNNMGMMLNACSQRDAMEWHWDIAATLRHVWTEELSMSVMSPIICLRSGTIHIWLDQMTTNKWHPNTLTLLLYHGTSVRPSDHFPSIRDNLARFFVTGIPAEELIIITMTRSSAAAQTACNVDVAAGSLNL